MRVLSLIATALALSSAGAAEPDQAGRRLAATCAACHGTDGMTAGDTLPGLAGQPREALKASLLAFKAGSRPATVMHQLAKGYSDEQIEALATYFAARKP